MFQLKFLKLLFLALLMNRIEGLTEEHFASIFIYHDIEDYCDMHCGANNHTLCPKPHFVDSHCDYIDPIDVDQDFIEETLNGHNGMRNRYADILRVSNMIKLEWDKELVAMAELWLARCHNYEIDPCALLDNVEGKRYEDVGQNTIFNTIEYLPKFYETQYIRDWYLEAATMNLPETKDGKVYFHVTNNFTQIIHGATERLGCASARTNNGVRLVCNYYPKYRVHEESYSVGRPASACPTLFPIRSGIFENLCTAGCNDNRMKFSLNYLLLFSLILTSFF